MRHSLTTSASILLLSFASATGQNQIQPAPNAVLQELQLRTATVQTLAVPANSRRNVEVSVVLGGRRQTLGLWPHNIRAPGFKLLVDDGQAIREAVAPPEDTYQGKVVGVANSSVALSIIDGQVLAHISMNGVDWAIQPVTNVIKSAARASHVVYRNADVTAMQRCAFSNGLKAAPVLGNVNPLSLALQSCEIALDCENANYIQNNSNVATTQSAATAIINAVDVIYRRDTVNGGVNICYQIGTIIVRTAKKYTQGPEIGCSAGQDLLKEMQTIWNRDHTAVKRDLAHLFSGQKGGKTAGCAFGGVVCSQTAGYGATRTDFPFSSIVGICAHEIGHNWSASHCDTGTISKPCLIMCSGTTTNICGSGSTFGPQAVKEILAHKASRSCLGTCTGCPEAATYSFFGQPCKGSGKGSGPACVTSNWNNTNGGYSFQQALTVGVLANSGASARQIVSLDFYSRASAAFTTKVYLYSAGNDGKPDQELASANMSIGTTLAVSTATFASPVGIGANTDFFVVFDVPATPTWRYSASSTGTNVDWYIKGTGGWSQKNPGFTETWSYRLNCVGAGASPLLSSTSLPQLGKSHAVSVSFAPPSSIAVLWFSAGPLSLDLTAAGAPGCTAYVDFALLFFQQGAVANGAGIASFTPFGIPNNPTFCGAKYYQQVLVLDKPANSLGIAFTHRGEAQVGN